MQHALEISEAFEKTDSGPQNPRKFGKEVAKRNSGHVGSDPSSSNAGLKVEAPSKGDKNGKRSPPTPCTLPKCKGNNRLHWIADCQDFTDEDKRRYKDEVAAAKAHNGPARSIRSQTSGVAGSSKSVSHLQRRPDEDND